MMVKLLLDSLVVGELVVLAIAVVVMSAVVDVTDVLEGCVGMEELVV